MEFRLQPLGFVEFFLQNNNHQAVKKMKWIENRKNTIKKTVGILFDSLCVVVSVWVCVGLVCVCVRAYVGYNCVLMCICMGWSEVTNKYIYIYIYIYVWLNNKSTFCLYYFIKILLSFLTSVLVLGWNWWMNLPKLSQVLSNLFFLILYHSW